MSSKYGTSNCNKSATSDLAYGGPISKSQSQRTGSGSGSRSCKSQISSNSSNSAGAQQPPKLRKEKNLKKRNSNYKTSMPPVQSPGLAVDRPASAGSSKGAAPAAAVISATSLAMANVFTVEGGDLLTTTGPGPSDSTGFPSGTGASIVSSIGIV